MEVDALSVLLESGVDIEVEGRQEGGVEEPPLARHEVVAVACANANFHQFEVDGLLVGGLVGVRCPVSSVETGAHHEAARTPALEVALAEGRRKGEALAVERIVEVDVEGLLPVAPFSDGVTSSFIEALP